MTQTLLQQLWLSIDDLSEIKMWKPRKVILKRWTTRTRYRTWKDPYSYCNIIRWWSSTWLTKFYNEIEDRDEADSFRKRIIRINWNPKRPTFIDCIDVVLALQDMWYRISWLRDEYHRREKARTLKRIHSLSQPKVIKPKKRYVRRSDKKFKYMNPNTDEQNA